MPAGLHIRRHWDWFVVGPLLVGVIALCLYAVVRVQLAPERFQGGFDRIEVPPLPPYVPASWIEEVKKQSGLTEPFDLRDSTLLPRLQDAFARHVWVEAVEQVELDHDRRIVVRLRYREPAAVVEVAGGDVTASELPGKRRYLVDRHGVVLPSNEQTTSLEPDLPRIVGKVPPPNQGVGSRWGSSLIEDAAWLAHYLRDDMQYLRIAAIEVGTDPIDPVPVLRSEGGSRVIWGPIDVADSTRQACNGDKLLRLRAYVEEYGSLDEPNGPYLFDVRSPKAMLRKPLP